MSRFVGYLTAGYPDRETSLRTIRDLCGAGLDILELGFPARDASLDGAVIRAALERVDYALAEDMDYWRQVRRQAGVPIWLMGYRQDLLEGDRYLRLAREKLYDALVLPDVSETERAALRKQLREMDVSVVSFINDSQTPEERDLALNGADLIYHQLYCGPTGVAHTDSGYLKLYEYARAHTRARIYAGFGINTPERVQELLNHGYDGAIIGSAIMKHLTESETAAETFIREVHETVRRERKP